MSARAHGPLMADHRFQCLDRETNDATGSSLAIGQSELRHRLGKSPMPVLGLADVNRMLGLYRSRPNAERVTGWLTIYRESLLLGDIATELRAAYEHQVPLHVESYS